MLLFLTPSARLARSNGSRGLLGACLLALSVAALAGPPPAPSKPDFRKGVLYGKVCDAATGKPIADATVGVLDTKGHILAWGKTNAQGEYALAVAPKTALQLHPSRRRGLLEQVCRAVGNVVTAPVKAVGEAVTKPGQTVSAAVVSVATGTPAPLAAQMGGPGADDRARNPAERQIGRAGEKPFVLPRPADASLYLLRWNPPRWRFCAALGMTRAEW